MRFLLFDQENVKMLKKPYQVKECVINHPKDNAIRQKVAHGEKEDDLNGDARDIIEGDEKHAPHQRPIKPFRNAIGLLATQEPLVMIHQLTY